MTSPANLIFINARVFTADPQQPQAEAVAVQGNRIVFAGGQDQAIAMRGPHSRVVDAGGRTLMPGFIDAHFHLLLGAMELDGILLEDAATFDEMAARVVTFAGNHSNDSWLVGSGLRYHLGPGKTPLTRNHLDGIVADRPIYLVAYDGHTAWANTLALKMGGIFNGGEAGPNSEIVLDPSGVATGELREPGAFSHVSRLVPAPTDAHKRNLVGKALAELAAQGITSVHNMDGDPEQNLLFASLDENAELTCRIYLPYRMTPDTPITCLEREAIALKKSFTGGMLRGGHVKFFIDGVIESYTGLLVGGYGDEPANHGAANYEKDHYTSLVVEADRLGLQTCTHAVGDLGVRWALDACQAAKIANGKRDSRHRIEHIELVHPDDLPRFQELGVLASMQPLHAPAAVDGVDIWPARAGEERWGRSFAWQTLRESGARLVFGSDWPVVTQDVLLSVAHAVNRRPWTPGLSEQRQSLEDCLLSYTRDAAFAEFQENCKGQVKDGYLADLVLLSEDIFAIEPERIGCVRPWMTIVDGQVVYEAGSI